MGDIEANAEVLTREIKGKKVCVIGMVDDEKHDDN